MNYIYRFLIRFIVSPPVYRLSERLAARDVRSKKKSLDRAYQQSFNGRESGNTDRLIEVLKEAGEYVPYYKELFKTYNFNPESLLINFDEFYKLPYLTKEILRDRYDDLIDQRYLGGRHHRMKTGGSTGKSAYICYEQDAADWSAAVVLHCRESIGKKQSMSELHFASKFPDVFPLKDRIKEKIKCLAMNRQNIFFDRLSEPSLESIFREIMAKRPVLVHAHPSTIYALACYVERKYGPTQLFDIFESSGELLDENKRRVIEDNLKCSVIDRYGSAEFGVVAYQRRRTTKELQVLDTMFYPESLDDDKGAVKDVLPGELVVTSLKNTMMPLIRYRTGDRAKLTKREDGYYIDNLVGRIHDLVEIDGQLYPTHFLQDVLDRVGGVEEFQVATGSQSDDIILRIVAEQEADCELIEQRINGWWPSVKVVFISAEEIVHVGWRAKFRHFVSLDAV